MDHDEGIYILRVDFITGDYQITLKQTLYKNQGLSIKHVDSINNSFLIIIAEREHQMTKAYKLEQLNQTTKKEESNAQSANSKKPQISNLSFNIKKKFETIIIRHSLTQPQDSSGNISQISLPLRVH